MVFAGIALDEPLGRTDGRDFRIVGGHDDAAAKGGAATGTAGTAGGGRGGAKIICIGNPLFQCQGIRYGEFALPSEVKVGDFPPIDPFDLVDEI